ncbi:two component transcriptional regulator, LytTR family [Chitinophaga costaii]|uniref:Two component transcriptional regulator, LytTR family n=1 Tax=Chitinophaga costaii TaxID=1335309 RepID=A0A1C4BAC9_9BACT|nr:LytTR family DNA-binding domain-containing protein [Chitinophaga costaii]PUZ27693.1 DNA-binding response regulator [Chitinophaga costaii]SCC03648.1 two component transcriptional regulator, LytTR family [Chitinophaga costaii]
MKIRTLIVDDEPHAMEIIRKYATQIPEIEIVGTCGNAIEAFQTIQHNNIDLVFLDIKMPRLLGTDLVRSLKRPPMIIFTTAYQEYAIEGFDLNAIDYLLKPIPLKRFLQAIDKVMHFLDGDDKKQEVGESSNPQVTQTAHHFIYLRVDRRLVKVNTDDILWIESLKDYIKVTTKGKVFYTKQKISVMEKLLPMGEFLRIHRSFIIPLNKVEGYNPNHVLIAETKIPIGRNYKQICADKFDPRDGFSCPQEGAII